ncbi:hypothetical protein [Bacillus smithii]|uniref:hypothetical protein n=1 Tax=Bacillus smithii TaxID=1479 RepID=UPI00077C013D|nr:hypothetical protein [Bacillus smithii]
MNLEKVLWKNDFNSFAFLIDKKKVEERAWVSDQTLIIENVEPTTDIIEKLQNHLSEKEEEIQDDYEMKKFLKSCGLEGAEISWAEDFPEIEEKLAFDCYEQKFFLLTDAEPIKVYEWWDGSNRETLVLDENTSETELVITESFVDLDEWDGRNHVTGGIGEHERIYKVLEIDGQDVSDKDVFLLNEWSQWQGSHETGEIMDLDEVRQHLKDIGRDVEKYMFEIGKLSGE